jgi:hypothetical protein
MTTASRLPCGHATVLWRSAVRCLRPANSLPPVIATTGYLASNLFPSGCCSVKIIEISREQQRRTRAFRSAKWAISAGKVVFLMNRRLPQITPVQGSRAAAVSCK